MLALLALAGGRTVSVERLIDAIWGDATPDSARNALQVYASGLRKALATVFGPAGETWNLQSSGGGYRLQLPPGSVDADVFAAARDEADLAVMRGDYAAAREASEHALSLCSGTPLGGLDDVPFVQPESARLVDQMLIARELWADASLALNRSAEVAAELESVLADHPFCEPLWRRRMLALYRSGRQAEALAAYDKVRQALDDELGLDPSPELVTLHQAILRQDPSLRPDGDGEHLAGPAGPTPARRAVLTLPWFGNPLVGREDDAAQIVGLFVDDDARLVTLVGPGGVGKTRLAVDVTRRLAETYPDRTVFLDVTSARSADAVLEELARAFGAGDEAVTVGGLAHRLGSEPSLVTIDNIERLVDDLRPLLASVLAACPGLRVLLTSRVATALDGEYRVPLHGLAKEAAVTLFCDHARRAVRSFSIEEPTCRADVEQICERLDRLPLALELAAARLRLMTVSSLRDHLAKSVLTLSGSTALPEHRRTVRDIVAWSVELLSEENATALRLLGVFENGFTLEAAEAVLGDAGLDALQTLADLVDSSLVVGPAMEEALASATSPPRFRLLESIHDFCLEQLVSRGELDLARRRHATFYLERFHDPDEAALRLDESLRWLGNEVPNVRAALDHLLVADPDSAARLALAVARPLLATSHLLLLQAIIGPLLAEHPALSRPLRMQLAVLAGVMQYYSGDWHGGLEVLREHVPPLMAERQLGYPLFIGCSYLISALADDGEHEASRKVADASLELAESAGQSEWVSMIYMGGHYAARLGGDGERALELARASVELVVSTGQSALEGTRRESYAETLLALGRYDEAWDECERALAALDRAGAGSGLVARALLGRVLVSRGEYAEACERLIPIIHEQAEIGYSSRELSWLALALADSEPALAARLLGAAYSLNDEVEHPPRALSGPAFDRLEAEYGDLVDVGRAEGWPAILTHLDQKSPARTKLP